VNNRVDSKHRISVKVVLDAWFDEVSNATWTSPAELKQQYRSASVVSTERVVFNIKGNDYRLIVAISYVCQVLLIKWIGSHKEYDLIDAKEVAYDKSRNAGPAH
jgi:mRNA interferase HigB